MFSFCTINKMTWNMFIEQSKVDIGLVHDCLIYRAFRHMMIGGIVGIKSMSYAMGNNECMDNYDSKCLIHILCIMI